MVFMGDFRRGIKSIFSINQTNNPMTKEELSEKIAELERAISDAMYEVGKSAGFIEGLQSKGGAFADELLSSYKAELRAEVRKYKCGKHKKLLSLLDDK